MKKKGLIEGTLYYSSKTFRISSARGSLPAAKGGERGEREREGGHIYI